MSRKAPTPWPHLRRLLDGYLHQDLAAEHGSAPAAVQAWLSEAGSREVMAVSSEWRAFLEATAGSDLDTRTRLLRELAGGAWAPREDREFDVVSALLLGSRSR